MVSHDVTGVAPSGATQIGWSWSWALGRCTALSAGHKHPIRINVSKVGRPNWSTSHDVSKRVPLEYSWPSMFRGLRFVTTISWTMRPTLGRFGAGGGFHRPRGDWDMGIAAPVVPRPAEDQSTGRGMRVPRPRGVRIL